MPEHATSTCADTLSFKAGDEFATENDDVAVLNSELSSNGDEIICNGALPPAEDCTALGERVDSGVSSAAAMAPMRRKRTPKDSILDSHACKFGDAVCQIFKNIFKKRSSCCLTIYQTYTGEGGWDK